LEKTGFDDAGHLGWVDERLDCGRRNAEIVLRMYRAQAQISEIPTADFLLVEQLFDDQAEAFPEAAAELKKNKARGRTRPLKPRGQRHYFFHSLIGRAGNEALSRVFALRMSRGRGGNAVATADDYGFVLSVRPEQALAPEDLPALLDTASFADDLHEALSRSDLLKYHFRNAAQTGLMVYRNFFGEQKSLRKLQWSAEVIFNVLQQYEPDHILLREARRDAVHTYIDQDAGLAWLDGLRGKPVRLRKVERVPPLSFALFATKIKEALLVEDPREMTERLYHLWWSKIEDDHG
jgi:ATP-dependent Lhr-like helicase